jgi:hypothetical protein
LQIEKFITHYVWH